MNRWRSYLTAAGIAALAVIMVGQARAMEAYRQHYTVYWYGLAVGEADISLMPLEGARYQFQMRVRDHVPVYELTLDSSTIFRLQQERMIPEQAWIKGHSEGDDYDVRFHYQDGRLAQIEGFDKAVTITPPLIDYITFVARLAFDFSSDQGIQQYTVLTEKGKINEHRFAIRETDMVKGHRVHLVTELDSRDRTEMEVIADTGQIRNFIKYRKDKKRLEFRPQ